MEKQKQKKKKKTAKKSSRWSNLSLVDPKKKKKTFQRHYGKEVVLNATHLINYPLVLWATKLQLLFLFFLFF